MYKTPLTVITSIVKVRREIKQIEFVGNPNKKTCNKDNRILIIDIITILHYYSLL